MLHCTALKTIKRLRVELDDWKNKSNRMQSELSEVKAQVSAVVDTSSGINYFLPHRSGRRSGGWRTKPTRNRSVCFQYST